MFYTDDFKNNNKHITPGAINITPTVSVVLSSPFVDVLLFPPIMSNINPIMKNTNTPPPKTHM